MFELIIGFICGYILHAIAVRRTLFSIIHHYDKALKDMKDSYLSYLIAMKIKIEKGELQIHHCNKCPICHNEDVTQN